MSKFSKGVNTLEIPMQLFKDNRSRLVNELKKQNEKVRNNGQTYILLQGGDEVGFYDTDVLVDAFRQESYFQYLFGVSEPGFYGLIRVSDGFTTLFAPKLPDEYEVWMGRLLSLDDFKKKYEVDEVCYVDDIERTIGSKNPSLILTLTGRNSDSGRVYEPAKFDGIEKFILDSDILFPILAELRTIKSPGEIEILRYVAKVSSDAHKKVMKMPFLSGPHYEYQAEAEFLAHTYYVGGCRHMSYTCICGAGTNSAVLHYGHAGAPNSHPIRDGDMCLFDMGANYCGYAADITCSFPANGKFTEDQKLIYNAVLAANMAVQRSAKEGVSWVDMHLLANRAMLEELKKGNIVTGNVDEMIEAGIGAIFQPHGLGHFLGLDVHDVGGYLPHCPPRPEKPGVNRLRTARVLKAGMYLTIEPGCYFIEKLLNSAFADPVQSKFLVRETIDRFWNFGGVRIEDDVLITKDGIENFSIVPRTVEEIEEWMKEKDPVNYKSY